MVNNSFSPIRSFPLLGTGRKRRTFIIADSENLLTAEQIEEVTIDYNHPCRSEIGFTDGSKFDMRTETVNGKKMCVFPWSSEASDMSTALKQRSVIANWCDTARAEDVQALSGCVAEILSIKQSAYASMPFDWAKRQVLLDLGVSLKRLNIRELQRVTALLWVQRLFKTILRGA
jgi:hypothetical protein